MSDANVITIVESLKRHLIRLISASTGQLHSHIHHSYAHLSWADPVRSSLHRFHFHCLFLLYRQAERVLEGLANVAFHYWD